MSDPDLSRKARLFTEIRASALLAAPLVIGQLSSMGMNVIDTVLAGRHGTTTLAAIGVGAPAWSIVILVCVGVLMAVPPSVAQLDGAGKREKIGPLFRQALWLALALGLGLFVVVRLAPLLLAQFISAAVMPEVQGFLHGISWGAPALALYFCLRYLSEGVAWTVPTMVVGVGGLLVLLPLGYALMFGWRFLPELGATGLGIATAAVLWLQVLVFASYLRLSPRYADLKLFSHWEKPNGAAIAELLRIGVPMGIAIFMEGSLFVATALIIGTLGEVPVAAHQIAIIVASVCFMVPLGVAMATTVRVGQAAGAGNLSGVRWAAAAGHSIGLVTQTLAAAVLIFGGAWLAGLITRDSEVIALAATLMLYAAVFQYADGVQAISGGALRGMKDTRIPMFITVFAYWALGLPLGAWFGLNLERGAPGLWIGLIIGLGVASVLLSWRFVRLTRQPL